MYVCEALHLRARGLGAHLSLVLPKATRFFYLDELERHVDRLAPRRLDRVEDCIVEAEAQRADALRAAQADERRVL